MSIRLYIATLPATIDAAQAYKGIIPVNRWKEPNMTKEKLQHEIEEGVEFWGYEEDFWVGTFLFHPDKFSLTSQENYEIIKVIL